MRYGRPLGALVGLAGGLVCLDQGARGDIYGGATVMAPPIGAESPAEHEARIQAALIARPVPGLQVWPEPRPSVFKAYIARIHRPIHRRWGYGVLVDWDKLPLSDPMNKQALSTVLEIILDGNGSVERLAIVQTSQYLPFDTAAVEAVLSAAPFIQPPSEILSPDGRAYVQWTFNRDERACGTDGVKYFTTPGAHPTGETLNGAERPAASGR